MLRYELKDIKLSRFKLVAIDMDGTLLNSSGELSKKSIQFFNENKFDNLDFMFATGRMPQAVKKHLESLNVSDTVISHNGALVSNLVTGEVLDSHKLEENIIKACHLLNKNESVVMHVNTENSVIAKRRNTLSEAYADQLDIEMTYDKDKFVEYVDVYSILFIGDKPYLDQLLSKLQKMSSEFGFVLIDGIMDKWMLQILSPRISKGQAVLNFAKRKGIKKREIIAFGDNYNDIEMLRDVGIGIAMGNSNSDIKNISDIVAQTNDENGVINILNALMKE